MTLTGKGIAPAKATAHGAGPVTLTVRAAKSKLATLEQSGRLATKLTVTLKPSNGGASADFGEALTLRSSS